MGYQTRLWTLVEEQMWRSKEGTDSETFIHNTDSLDSTPLLINFSCGLKSSLRLGLHHAVEPYVEIFDLTPSEHSRFASYHGTSHENTTMIAEWLCSLLKSFVLQVFHEGLFAQVACYINKVIIILAVLKQERLLLALVFCPMIYTPVRKFIFWLMNNLLRTMILSQCNQLLSVNNEYADYWGFIL